MFRHLIIFYYQIPVENFIERKKLNKKNGHIFSKATYIITMSRHFVLITFFDNKV